MAYAPPGLEVQAGQSVVWVNNDLVPHTVTAREGAFRSQSVAPRCVVGHGGDEERDVRVCLSFPPDHDGHVDRQVSSGREMVAPSASFLASVPDDDVRLMQRAADGAVAAFEALMRRHNRRLYRVARALLRDDAEAEDALQEAYISAHGALRSYRGEASPVTFAIAVGHPRMPRSPAQAVASQQPVPHQRPRRAPGRGGRSGSHRQRRHARHAPSPRPDAIAARAQAGCACRGLPERLVLRAVEELSVEEDEATSLGIPEATVRSRHHRARSMLRESLAQEIDLAERDLYAFGGGPCDRIVANVLAPGAGSGAARRLVDGRGGGPLAAPRAAVRGAARPGSRLARRRRAPPRKSGVVRARCRMTS